VLDNIAWDMGMRVVGVLSAATVAVVMIIVLCCRKDLSERAKGLALGILATMGALALSRVYWFITKIHLETGDVSNYLFLRENSWLLTPLFLIFVWGCAKHIRTILPEGAKWGRWFLVGVVTSFAATVFIS